MAIVEAVTDAEASRSQSHHASGGELKRAIDALSKRLALPAELLPSFMPEERPISALKTYRQHALDVLRDITPLLEQPAFQELPVEDQADVIWSIARLYGHDDWTSTELREAIHDMTRSLDTTPIALHILNHQIRDLFTSTPHPMLHTTTSRALPGPAGGPDAASDFHDTSARTYKAKQTWGSHNVLAWCASVLPAAELEKRIGLILPPTLTLMDDWEPPWRQQGVRALRAWMDKVPAETMRRMGIDKLLLNSLVHTLALHASPPLKDVMPVTISMVRYTTTGQARAERFAEAMEKGIIAGWMYAPSGIEGRPLLAEIAREVELLCAELGAGIVRWLKAIIPSLLTPLQYTPSPAVMSHFEANLSALLCVCRTVATTGRVDRWRGQILDVLSRLWVHLEERGDEEDAIWSATLASVRRLIKDVFAELHRQCPDVEQAEFAKLRKLDKIFEPLVAVKA